MVQDGFRMYSPLVLLVVEGKRLKKKKERKVEMILGIGSVRKYLLCKHKDPNSNL